MTKNKPLKSHKCVREFNELTEQRPKQINKQDPGLFTS